MVAVITGPYSPPVIPHNPLPNLDQPSQPRVSHADPLLAPGPYDAGHNIHDCLRQTQQTGDEFATELIQLARRAFPNLPPSDRDDLVLDHFTSGLRDHAVVNHFIFNPPTNLTAALQLCRRYDSRKIQDITPNPCNPFPMDQTYILTPSTSTQPPDTRPPTKRTTLPLRFPNHNPGCPYCAAYGPHARHCGHNSP
ncbi:unnamed protein product, partial [Schistocephalus solidus]|uniref:Uncharacterized protein n=1 Tax=Schistocephalus solidus TaxID=70667 RepID=A0A183TU79_SCHSO